MTLLRFGDRVVDNSDWMDISELEYTIVLQNTFQWAR